MIFLFFWRKRIKTSIGAGESLLTSSKSATGCNCIICLALFMCFIWKSIDLDLFKIKSTVSLGSWYNTFMGGGLFLSLVLLRLPSCGTLLQDSDFIGWVWAVLGFAADVVWVDVVGAKCVIGLEDWCVCSLSFFRLSWFFFLITRVKGSSCVSSDPWLLCVVGDTSINSSVNG